MKLLITCDREDKSIFKDYEVNGDDYRVIDVFDDLSKMDEISDNSCKEIFMNRNTVSSVNYSVFQEILPKILTKLRKKGVLKLEYVDAVSVARKLVTNAITVQEFNDIITDANGLPDSSYIYAELERNNIIVTTMETQKFTVFLECIRI